MRVGSAAALDGAAPGEGCREIRATGVGEASAGGRLPRPPPKASSPAAKPLLEDERLKPAQAAGARPKPPPTAALAGLLLRWPVRGDAAGVPEAGVLPGLLLRHTDQGEAAGAPEPGVPPGLLLRYPDRGEAV